MGLDMYVYHIEKIPKQELDAAQKLRYDEVLDKYLCINAEYIEDAEYHDILPYMQKVENIATDSINDEKLRAAYNIPEDWYLFGCSNDNTRHVFSFTSDDSVKTKDIVVTNEELQKFFDTSYQTYYIAKCTEVMYWRKAYQLQDMLHNAYRGSILNCGYHRLNQDMVQAIKRYGADEVAEAFEDINIQDDFGKSTETDGYFYLEWY